jgi:hypothetical protein
MSAARRKIPNFLIVGAAKAGTTSLHAYLRQHPDIFMPAWKELSFFIGDAHGPLHRVRKPAYYDSVFAGSENTRAVGEASTSYLFDREAPSIIRSELGRIKILIILRDPVAMSYSLYNHQVRRGGETITDFESALAVEDKRRSDPEFKKGCYGWHANYYYFRRGLYSEQVQRYLDTFGQDFVKILLFDELSRDALSVVQEIFRFLDVDDTFVPDIRVHNPGGGIVDIPRFWQDRGLFLKTYQYVFSKNIFKKVPHLLRNIGRKPAQPLNPDTARNLRQRYYDDICRLEEIIGKDLSAWKHEKL